MTIRHLARWLLHALGRVEPLDTRSTRPARLTISDR